MRATGADALMMCLEKEGVSTVFGYPGGAVLSIYDALTRCSIRHILTRNEQAAVHAASGFARVTGKVGVCFATSGPGAVNMVTGIATAYMDSIPIVAITGQVSTDLIGKDVFQEVDITGATAPFIKHNYLVKEVSDIPRIVKEAFHIASTGRPGPVLIDLPKDVVARELDFNYPSAVDLKGYKPTTRGHTMQVQRAAAAIDEAKRPVICAGGGIISSGCSAELVELAEKSSIPVVTTLMGIGAIPSDHELSLGLLGMHGNYHANMAVSQADLIIALGARFGDRVIGKADEFAPNAKIIHVDIDPAEIGKNIEAHIPIVGDVGNVIRGLLEEVHSKERPEWLRTVNRYKNENPVKYGNCSKIKPQCLIEMLSELTRGNCIITTDVGQHQMWTAQYFKFKKSRSFLSSGGLGTMGYGVSAAVGAKAGRPESLVVAITGDGSFQMNMAEIATAVEHGLPIKVIVMINSSLGLVKQLQEYYCGGRYSAVNFSFVPDFVKIAEGLGAKAERISSPDEVVQALSRVIESNEAYVLVVDIDAEENVYPIVLNGSPISEMVFGR